MNWCESCDKETKDTICPECARPVEIWDHIVNVCKGGLFYFEIEAGSSRSGAKATYSDTRKRFGRGHTVTLVSWPRQYASDPSAYETILTNDPREE